MWKVKINEIKWTESKGRENVTLAEERKARNEKKHRRKMESKNDNAQNLKHRKVRDVIEINRRKGEAEVFGGNMM